MVIYERDKRYVTWSGQDGSAGPCLAWVPQGMPWIFLLLFNSFLKIIWKFFFGCCGWVHMLCVYYILTAEIQILMTPRFLKVAKNIFIEQINVLKLLHV